MTVNPAQRIKTTLKIDSSFKRSYTTVYEIYADESDGTFEVINADGIPAFGSWYKQPNGLIDYGAFCNGANLHDNPVKAKVGGQNKVKWTMTVTHGASSSKKEPARRRESPLDEPPVVSGSFVKYMEQALRDKDGNPILNTATEAFDPPFEEEKSYDDLRIQLNTANIDLGFRAGFSNAVNSKPMWGLKKRQIKLDSWRYNVVWFGDLNYVEHDFKFLINDTEWPDDVEDETTVERIGWYQAKMNQSFRNKDEGTGDLQNNLDPFDIPFQRPRFLDKDGKPTDTESWRVVAVQKEKDFLEIPGITDPLPGPFV